MNTTWFITGSASGLGRAFAEHALEQGHNVVATGRRLEPLRELEALHPGRLLVERLDVTRPEDIERAVARRHHPLRTHRRAGEQRRLRHRRRGGVGAGLSPCTPAARR